MEYINNDKVITLYSDGSCNPKYRIGGWAAVIITLDNEVTLNGKEYDTTHNRMELISVIKAIDYIKKNFRDFSKINVYSDSQYVVKITERKDKILNNNYMTKSGNPIRNADLVEKLIQHIDTLKIKFIKVKAHQKKKNDNNYNRDVDKLSRKIVRQIVAEIASNQ